jgi:proteasome alpha subunit
MEVFEEKYKDGITREDAIKLGLDALHKATEGKLNADALEIGVVAEKQSFAKLSPGDVKKYVDAVDGGGKSE